MAGLTLAFWRSSDAILLVEAKHTAWLLSLVGVGSAVTGPGIVTLRGGPSIVITAECSGAMSMTLYASLIAPAPGVGWRAKAWGVAEGLAALYLANLARLAATLLAYKAFGEVAVGLAHRVVGGALLLVVAITMWGLWLRDVLPARGPTGGTVSAARQTPFNGRPREPGGGDEG